jgi:DNA-binding transcriptional LysR family regulator
METIGKSWNQLAVLVRRRMPAVEQDQFWTGRVSRFAVGDAEPVDGFGSVGDCLRGNCGGVGLSHLSSEMFREPVIVAIPKGHPLAQLDAVPVTRLASERLILYARDGAPEVFDSITAMCKKARFSAKVADTPGSWHSVLTMVESNEGLALIPQCVKHLKGNNIAFRPLRDGGCKLDAIVAWRRNEPGVLQESFLNLVKLRHPEPVRIY